MEKNGIKRAFAVLLAMTLVFAFAACGSAGGQGQSASSAAEPSEDEGAYIEVSLSYPNMNYIESGDPGQYGKLIRGYGGEIDVDVNEPVDDMIFRTIKALRVFPVDIKGIGTFVNDDITINGVTLEDGIAIVDISGDKIYELDMYQETYFIYQVTDTILQSFEKVNGVKFTVDGQQVDELSYMDLSQVYTTDTITAFLEEA